VCNQPSSEPYQHFRGNDFTLCYVFHGHLIGQTASHLELAVLGFLPNIAAKGSPKRLNSGVVETRLTAVSYSEVVYLQYV